jgi:catechol 2,3-dioxygenase-like lactoylglutathione lyase family enzyme
VDAISDDDNEYSVKMNMTLDHVGFSVLNLDRSLVFYCDLLEMVLLWERVYEEEYVRILVGYPTLRLRCAYLQIPGSTVTLELLEYQNVPRQSIGLRRADRGNAHLALSVADLNHICQRLKEAGVTFVSEPVISSAGHYKGTKTVYIEDPDGISVQLMEVHTSLR